VSFSQAPLSFLSPPVRIQLLSQFIPFHHPSVSAAARNLSASTDGSRMKRDIKILLAGVVLIALAMLALAGMDLRPVSPDLGPTFRGHAYHWVGGISLICVLIGSMLIGGAAVAFCSWMSSKKLSITAVLFLLAAAVVSVASRAFVVTTYAYVPVILPWMVSVASGVLLLVVAIVRAISSRWGLKAGS
jgi:hypothetical protein